MLILVQSVPIGCVWHVRCNVRQRMSSIECLASTIYVQRNVKCVQCSGCVMLAVCGPRTPPSSLSNTDWVTLSSGGHNLGNKKSLPKRRTNLPAQIPKLNNVNAKMFVLELPFCLVCEVNDQKRLNARVSVKLEVKRSVETQFCLY